jgi:hypothetical protein
VQRQVFYAVGHTVQDDGFQAEFDFLRTCHG